MNDTVESTTSGAPNRPRMNPFVGPRPYRTGERLYGREYETLELLDVLTADRIVLFYSPSGAGKTSLVQAALVPALLDRSFFVPRVARVTFETGKQASDPCANSYVYSLLLSLEEDQPNERQLPVAALARMSIADYLVARWPAESNISRLALILDQFEEILTVDPTDQGEKREFFKQLGAALDNRRIWALLSMREEHIAGLDPYRSFIPTYLRSRFRLELLNDSQAREAMRATAELEGVDFWESAAQKLADDLRRVRVVQLGSQSEERLGPTIEPTVLQVVCLRLWDRLPSGKQTIDDNDVQALGNADTALADYYAETMMELGEQERRARDWVEEALITQRDLRNQILVEDAIQSGRVDMATISLLDGRHLVRAEQRRGVTWLELAHDRLVTPIRNNNAAWRDATLTPFQRQALFWDRAGRPNHLELRGGALNDAGRWAKEHRDELTETEQELLKASRLARSQRRGRLALLLAPIALIAGIVVFEGYRRWFEGQPWGYVTSLIDGETHALSGNFDAIGRNIKEEGLLWNNIPLTNGVVSRVHLFVTQAVDKNGSTFSRADDLRSLNGTIINGRFVQYGHYRKLKSGDLIAIAGVAVFQFEETKPAYLPYFQSTSTRALPMSKAAWALFLDGASRKTVPLEGSQYFLDADSDGSLEPSSQYSDRTMVEGGPDPDRGFTMVNTSKKYSLFAMFKYEDRTYLSLQVPPGKALLDTLGEMGRRLKAPDGVVSGTEYLSKMSFCLAAPVSQRMDGFEGLAVIESDEEPACTIGPFQIVIVGAEQ